MLERTASALTAALVLTTALACSGGGAESVTGGDPGGGLAGGFATAEPSPGPKSVGVVESEVVGDLVRVAIRVTDTDDVFAAGFDVLFDPASVAFVSWERGSLLETGGESVIYTVSPQADRVVVGLSRTAPAAGATAQGSRELVALTFRMLQAGDSALALADGFLLDSQPPGPTEIAGVGWSGGTFLTR